MISLRTSAPLNLDHVKRIGTGLAFIIFPLIFNFAFAVHPGLLNPHLLSERELILRAHGDDFLAFGHVLVLLCTPLLIVVVLRFMKLLGRGPAAWVGFIGGAIAVLGAVMLARDPYHHK